VVGGGHAPLGLLAPGFAAGLFWLIGVPVAYVVTAMFYLWRGHRRGVRTTWRAYVFVGVGLFAVVALLTVNLPRRVPGRRLFIRLFDYLPGDLVVRGLVPLLAIAVRIHDPGSSGAELGLWAVRDRLLRVALTANLYDIGERGGPPGPARWWSRGQTTSSSVLWPCSRHRLRRRRVAGDLVVRAPFAARGVCRHDRRVGASDPGAGRQPSISEHASASWPSWPMAVGCNLDSWPRCSGLTDGNSPDT